MEALAAPSRTYRLGLNENPYGPTPAVRRALAHALGSANRYPELLPTRLPALIAERLGCAAERVLVGPGGAGVIMLVLQEFVAPGDRVVFATPTYDGYPVLTRTVGGVAVPVPLWPDGGQDLAGLVAAVDDRTRLVVVCSPHNPTGTVVTPEALCALLDGLDPKVLVLLDEAYIEFIPAPLRCNTVELVDRYPNLLVLRTFSKAYGLAALRIGYAVGTSATITRIRRWQLPFGMNSLAEVGVRACYAAEAELAERIAAITSERDRLATGLLRLGFEMPDSHANFLYLPHADAAAARRVRAALDRAGIEVRAYPNGTRITVGKSEATDAVLEAVLTTVNNVRRE